MESFQDRVIKEIKASPIGNAICPLCHQSDWGVQEGVYRFRVHTKAGTESTREALPSIALVCNVCGNTQFINLLVFGDTFRGDI